MRTLEYLDVVIPSSAEQIETWKRLRKQWYEEKPIALPAPKQKPADIIFKPIEAEDETLNRLTSLPVLILKIIAKFFQKPIDAFYDRRRKENIIYRQIGMASMIKFTKLSTTKISQKFGKFDHTTVMHAFKKIEKLRKNDQVYNYYLSHLDVKIEKYLQEIGRYDVPYLGRRKISVKKEKRFMWCKNSVDMAVCLCLSGKTQKEIARTINAEFNQNISPAAVSSMLLRRGFSIKKNRELLK